MNQDEPVQPTRPGRYGNMTAAEFNARFARYKTPGVLEQEIAAAAGKTPRVPHPPKRAATPEHPEPGVVVSNSTAVKAAGAK